MKRLIGFFTRLSEAYLPDAFVFCLLLTLVVYVFGLFLTPHSPLALVDFWGRDFWSLNAFAMQMVFILITGHMLATTPAVKKLLRRLSSRIESERGALILISLFSICACWVNWGFGLIISGVLAIELARKLGKVNFGLFIATAYSGFLVWHGGLSGSIPLRIAGNDEILQKVLPGLKIPLSETIFSPFNLAILGALVLSLPVLSLCLRTEHKVELPAEAEAVETEEGGGEFRDRLERSPVFNFIFFGFFLIVIGSGFKDGAGLDINRVNFIFLFSAFFLHQTPQRFLKALQGSVGYASGIIIQFPFYAGIMGLMQHSGLADLISALFVDISSARTLPLWTFFSGGLVNFFVPSGGGQWVVQGPIVLKAALDLGASPSKIAMALAWGDAWTNMIQPFWALPLLGLAGIKLRDIMGYCLIFTFWSALVIGGVLLVA
jgi:short-chain fatty acids transporter